MFWPCSPSSHPRLPLPQSERPDREDPVPACLLWEIDGKGHYLSCSLELQLTRGLHIYCSFDLTSVPCARCCPPISQAGEPRLTVVKRWVSGYVDFQWWPRTSSPHPHSFLWSSSTGLQQTASVSNGFMRGQFTQVLTRAEFESVFDRIGIGAEQHVDQSFFSIKLSFGDFGLPWRLRW